SASAQAPKPVEMRRERGPRPLWRLLLGSGLIAAGAGMVGLSAYAFANDGQCVIAPMPPVQICPTIYSGIPAGAPPVTCGALSIAAGIVTIALPGKFRMVPVTVSDKNAPGPKAAGAGLSSSEQPSPEQP